MPQIKKIKNKVFWVDGSGVPVERSRIKKEEKEREKIVNKAIKQAVKVSESMIKFNEEVVQLVDDYLEMVADQYGEHWQGAASITNFDQSEKIDIKISKLIDFNEHFAIAEKKIFDYIENLTENLSGDIVSIIRVAFSRNKKGFIDPKKILELKKLNIKNKVWKEAMDLIDKSIYVKKTNRYITFWIRNKKGDWESIPLNFSKL